MDTLSSIGKLLKGGEHRDAIHFAVAPVVAAERLSPGQHVGFVQSNQEVVGGSGSPASFIGIIDPFLDAPVRKGERCWLFLYPHTITSIRHEWVHPAFSAAEATAPESSKSASEKWMRAWAMEHMSEDYYGDRGRVDEQSAYAFALRAGDEHFIGPYEEARDHIDSEWWAHWEIITGRTGDREAYFSCAC